jgi:hypothetical protein
VRGYSRNWPGKGVVGESSSGTGVHGHIHSVLSDRRMLLSWPFCLDGYIAREDDSMDWLFTDGDYGFSEFYESTDIIISVEKRMNKS